MATSTASLLAASNRNKKGKETSTACTSMFATASTTLALPVHTTPAGDFLSHTLPTHNITRWQVAHSLPWPQTTRQQEGLGNKHSRVSLTAGRHTNLIHTVTAAERPSLTARCTLTHSLTVCTLTHSLTHSVYTHSLTHSLTHSVYTHSLTHSVYTHSKVSPTIPAHHTHAWSAQPHLRPPCACTPSVGKLCWSCQQ
eukprot:1138092-Pelagomonas_calceolata.AAC.2